MEIFFQNEVYLSVGKIIALSILHGGPGPFFFAPCIIDYLFGGIGSVTPSVDDVPDREVQSKLKRVGHFYLSLIQIHY